MAMMMERKSNVLIQFFFTTIKTENVITTHAFLVVRPM
jgi:hypothetical protein